jgi:hypothetical protein
MAMLTAIAWGVQITLGLYLMLCFLEAWADARAAKKEWKRGEPLRKQRALEERLVDEEIAREGFDNWLWRQTGWPKELRPLLHGRNVESESR